MMESPRSFLDKSNWLLLGLLVFATALLILQLLPALSEIVWSSSITTSVISWRDRRLQATKAKTSDTNAEYEVRLRRDNEWRERAKQRLPFQ
jgi:hypothetical protein